LSIRAPAGAAAQELRAVDVVWTMRTRYVANGLQLCSAFALPRLSAAEAPQLPALSLTLGSAAEINAAWSAGGDAPAWRGRLSDGCDLTVERGRAGDTLFSYGTRARFWLDASGERLACAPVEGAKGDWRAALLEKVIPKVSLMRGYEGLHASAVDSPDGVIAFLGASGAGKSTLAQELANRGHALFADDVLALGRADGGVLAHPDAGPGARPLSLLCLLGRATGLALELQRISANPLALAPHMLGFRGDRERQRVRFELYADLLLATPVVIIAGDLADHPGDLADLVERGLSEPPPVAGVAVSA